MPVYAHVTRERLEYQVPYWIQRVGKAGSGASSYIIVHVIHVLIQHDISLR